MKFIYLCHVDQGYLKGSVWVGQRNKVTIFGEFVYHYQDTIKPTGFRETFNEI